jgi:hypothetical protein
MGTSSWSITQWLAAAPACGLPSTDFVPTEFQAQCSTVAGRHVPPGAPSDFVTVCTASLIARGIIYFKNVPGDCGTPTQLNLSEAQEASAAGGVAIGIASMAGAALPGIGAAVQAIATIFSNHAKAVANEQAIICQVAGVVNQVFAYYDQQVRSGNISPSTAYAGMQTYLAQVNGQLASIEKSCNASCVYQGIIAAHADFVESYYPQISPVQIVPLAPGAPPATITPTAPGGVIKVGTSSGPVAVGPAPAINVSPGPKFVTGNFYSTYDADGNAAVYYYNGTSFQLAQNWTIVQAWGKLPNETAAQNAVIQAPHGSLVPVGAVLPASPPEFSSTDLLVGAGFIVLLGVLLFSSRKGATA